MERCVCVSRAAGSTVFGRFSERRARRAEGRGLGASRLGEAWAGKAAGGLSRQAPGVHRAAACNAGQVTTGRAGRALYSTCSACHLFSDFSGLAFLPCTTLLRPLRLSLDAVNGGCGTVARAICAPPDGRS